MGELHDLYFFSRENPEFSEENSLWDFRAIAQHSLRAIALDHLLKQGVFILGGKKEMKSDLLLIKLQKDHYFLCFKIC